MIGLRDILPSSSVLEGVPRDYLVDETQTRDVVGRADAVVLPHTVEEVAETVRFAYTHGIPIVPRGGGTGYAGGAVPDGGIVVSTERLQRVRRFDPLLWRIEVEAGVVTARLRDLVRSNGLYFPPDPGAAEQSNIGGNVATNAGGPHAFKYGTTGAWVTGLEVVVPPGEIVRFGGAVRKDVSGYDLKHLLIGSEGTLGIITAAWLRLIPAPEASRVAVAFFPDARAGCEAIEAIVGSGVPVAALEFVDEGAVAAAPPSFVALEAPAFAVLVETDGTADEAERMIADAVECFSGALTVVARASGPATDAVWRWREGMTAGVTARLGGKVSEDVVVPLDRLHDAITATRSIGERHGLLACSWGHAGDGNLHSTFMIRRDSPGDVAAATAAAADLFRLVVELGGSISGEHGIGLEKAGQLERAWSAPAYALHREIKRVFDPANLLNPGKKV